MNWVRWSMGDASLHGMGTSSVPCQSFGRYPCPWTKLLPMCPDRTGRRLTSVAADARGGWPPTRKGSRSRWSTRLITSRDCGRSGPTDQSLAARPTFWRRTSVSVDPRLTRRKVTVSLALSLLAGRALGSSASGQERGKLLAAGDRITRLERQLEDLRQTLKIPGISAA